MPKNRLEAFADGVFAFAATLLILNLTFDANQRLGPQLADNWTSYVAYVISFLTIGIIWMNHHAVMNQIGHVDRLFLILNVVFLMFIASIPFPTRLLALYIRTDSAQLAALNYGITLTATAVIFNALWWYAARHRRLIRHDADEATVTGIGRSFVPGPFVYLFATLAAIVNPYLSAGLYGAVALFYVLESSVFGRRG